MFRPLLTLTCAASLLGSTALAAPHAMTSAEARHLLSRTGFGAAPHEITDLVGQSRASAVDQILAGVSTRPATDMPGWTREWAYPGAEIGALGQPAEELFFGLRWQEIEELQQWWLSEMITTPSPLTERLVLFWHDHFATSFEAVENSQWMADQNQFFRAHAAGGFADLASGILRDPAMLVYLTNTENMKDAPNENLAREFMELFTLGEGRGYTEADVKEAARALTGHTVSEFGAPVHKFDRESHDAGRKTILGQRGRHDADDLPRLVMQHPQFGTYIVEKLWLEFVSDQPDPAEVQRLVRTWRAAGWEMKPLLKEMFLSDAFWDPANRGRLVKSPVELFVGTVRTMGIPVPDLGEAAWALEDMGQALFFPPNVGGWPDGAAWINDAGAGQRAAYMTMLLDQDFEDTEAGNAMMASYGMSGDAVTPVEVSVDLGPRDLRVGHVFGRESWSEDGEQSLLLSLYDIGYGDQTWRSISVWIEHFSEDDESYVAVHTGDCAPACFASWPREEDYPDWVGFAPGDPDSVDGTTSQDRALMASLVAHLPKLIRETKGQMAWVGYEDDEEDPVRPAKMSTMVALAKEIGSDSRDLLGKARGTLLIEPSARGSLGLGDAAAAPKSMGQVEDMLEAMYDEGAPGVAPTTTYASPQTWLAALGVSSSDVSAIEGALLAVPRATTDALDGNDAEDVLRGLLTSPYYQVH